MITVHTETGSVYEFDTDNMKTRRLTESNLLEGKELRRDEEWITLVTAPEPVIGESMRFVISLYPENPDLVTLRTTSYVTKVD